MDKVDAKSGGDAPDAKGHPGAFQGGVSSAPVISASDFTSDKYKMNHEHRGIAVIINNTKFDKHTGLDERIGSDVDASGIYDTLIMLKFEKILIKRELKALEIKQILHKVAKEDHSNNDCFVCIILSHGEEGYVWGVDNKVAMDELVAPFKGDKCKSLAGKPKIFFIQACRGTKLDAGVTENDGQPEMESDEVEQRRIPTEADFLLAYSVVPGFYAWRNSNHGSWFIQAIVSVFKRHWEDMDLLSMMTRVNKKVAYDFESNASKAYMSCKKQIPCITSMLTKDVYFKSQLNL